MTVIADARPDNWVDRFAPEATRPYLKLGRFDRPVGTWLLLWPCWWSITMAGPATLADGLFLAVLFGIGALVMRGAGCTINDIADRDFDAKVERTLLRPLPSGQVTLTQAVIWMGALCLIGLLILLQLPSTAIWLGVGSLGLVAAYPFMKRITWWPQAWLGLTFNWGALLGWAAVQDSVSLPAILLYIGGLFWTLGYDTIYAHQDKDDDALIGVKSSARRLGEKTRPALFVFYGLTLACWAASVFHAGLNAFAYVGLAAVGLHFCWQALRVDLNNSSNCLYFFKSNIWLGWLMLAALLAGSYL